MLRSLNLDEVRVLSVLSLEGVLTKVIRERIYKRFKVRLFCSAQLRFLVNRGLAEKAGTPGKRTYALTSSGEHRLTHFEYWEDPDPRQP